MKSDKYINSSQYHGERIATLESNMSHIVGSLIEIKDSIKSLDKEIKDSIKSLDKKIDTKFDSIQNRLWTLGVLTVTGFASVLYVIAKAHHWLT